MATEISSGWSGSRTPPRLEGGAVQECDWCGRAVHPGTGFQRVQRGADDGEVIVLCRECELGTD